MSEPDIVIAGAGPVGGVLACALARQRRVRVLDAAPPTPVRDDRSIGMTEGSRGILDQLGLWSELADVASPIRSLHISERGRFGTARVTAAEHGLQALGWVVPGGALFGAIARALAAHEGVELHHSTRVDSVTAGADEVALNCHAEAGPKTFRGRLLVGADGANSAVRAALGIGCDREDYGQLAIVTSVEFARVNDGVAYERFSREGPLAVLPRGGRECGVVWMLNEPLARERLALDDAAFAAALEQAFGLRLGRIRAVGSRAIYPLSRVRSHRTTSTRVVLAGNAAASLHPIAAQGFNLALRDVAALAEMLAEAAPDGDVGDAAMLARFAAARKPDHDRVERFTDGLVKLFSHDLPVVRGLRSLGLIAFDMLGPARAEMVRHSAGVGASAPLAARRA